MTSAMPVGMNHEVVKLKRKTKTKWERAREGTCTQVTLTQHIADFIAVQTS